MSKYKGIARYCHMVNPSSPKNSDKLSYSIVILIAKDDPQCAQITAEVEAAKKNGFPSGFPAKAQTNWNDCAVAEPENLAVQNYMAFKASTNADQTPPYFVDSGIQPIIDPAMDGKIVGKVVLIDAGVASYNKGEGGVKAYLNAVMDTGETGPIDPGLLSSRADAASIFGDYVQGAAPPPAPPSPAAPPPPAPNAVHQMTDKATATYEGYVTAGWSDEQMIIAGVMLPPGGVEPSFS